MFCMLIFVPLTAALSSGLHDHNDSESNAVGSSKILVRPALVASSKTWTQTKRNQLAKTPYIEQEGDDYNIYHKGWTSRWRELRMMDILRKAPLEVITVRDSQLQFHNWVPYFSFHMCHKESSWNQECEQVSWQVQALLKQIHAIGTFS